MKTVVVLFGALLFCGGASAKPVESAASLLARARATSGGDAWDAIVGLSANGTEKASGLSADWRMDVDLRDGRSRQSADFGVVRYAEGFDGRDHWRQDASGGLHNLDSAFARTATVTDAWLARRGWLRRDAAGAKIGAMAMRNEGERRYAVLTATPQGGQAVELWFDPASARLERSVRTMPISIVSVSYADYRKVDGIELPFSIITRDDAGNGDDIVELRTYQTRPNASDSDFARPSPPDDAQAPAAGTTVPLEFTRYLVVEAKLNGKGPFAFILDTGGHDIITPDVAQQLGLKAVGSGTSGGAGEGTMTQADVRVGRFEIGAAVMTDQHFFVMPLQYGTIERGARTPLAGIIGLEVFERFGTRIDYRAKTLTLRPRAGYRHVGGGVPLRMTFSDDQPLVEVGFEGKRGDFALDTGNGGSMLVQHLWAEKQGFAQRLKSGVELVSYGAGGASRNWASRVDRFDIAGQNLRHLAARYAEDKHGSFSSRTEAGNIGSDVLAHFTLDFDYAGGQVWFEPVPGWTPPPFDRSGVRAYKDRADAFTVALVGEHTPAAIAGVKANDEIIAVDGVAATQLSGDDWFHKITQAPGTSLALTLRRKGVESQAALTLRELLP
ncbi:aspartyl protease family protein [Dokdonella soli]|uniref:PDZ domain-containing protein n=1 Tax=Dokdonella soli TaxID=529810 RepID=A0ABN1IUL9_9GAMM